jgi:hypothetical protein
MNKEIIKLQAALAAAEAENTKLREQVAASIAIDKLRTTTFGGEDRKFTLMYIWIATQEGE